MKKLFILLLVGTVVLTGCFDNRHFAKTERFNDPDVKDDFCGAVISFQYCKCAFHNDYCDEIGMSRSEADAYVKSEYEKWRQGQLLTFEENCKNYGGVFVDDECGYCEEGFAVVDNKCVPQEEADLADNQEFKPDGPLNEDCTVKTVEFNQDWKKYSDIDNAIPKEDRSYEAQQALTAYETMIGKLVETFELQRDIEIEEQSQADLNEYRQALVQNQRANLLKAFWRMSWVTYSTIKSGISAGTSYSKVLTSAGSAVQSIGSGLKTVQATIPSNSDIAIDKSTITGKAMSVGSKTAMEVVESLGDPTKVAVRLVKSAADVTFPSANLSEAEINILRQQQIDKGVLDQVLAASQAANDERQARLTALETEIDGLEMEINEWENKERERVRFMLEDSCQKQKDGAETEE